MTSTTPTICDHTARRPSADSLSLFLSRYCARLLGAGATCIRLEKNAKRIAKAYGKEIELTIQPRHVHLSLWEEGKPGAVTSIAAVSHSRISFNVNTLLSRLSWEIADGKVTLGEAGRCLDRIVAGDRQSKTLVALLAAAANASFCRLFGGDPTAMLIVGLATLAGYILKQTLLAKGVDARLMVTICSFVSAVLGATDQLFSLGTTPETAIGTSVLYLVPGIPFINSFSDLLYHHYLCAISRFIEAVVLTCCLSIGLCAAMFLTGVGMF